MFICGLISTEDKVGGRVGKSERWENTAHPTAEKDRTGWGSG